MLFQGRPPKTPSAALESSYNGRSKSFRSLASNLPMPSIDSLSSIFHPFEMEEGRGIGPPPLRRPRVRTAFDTLSVPSLIATVVIRHLLQNIRIQTIDESRTLSENFQGKVAVALQSCSASVTYPLPVRAAFLRCTLGGKCSRPRSSGPSN